MAPGRIIVEFDQVSIDKLEAAVRRGIRTGGSTLRTALLGEGAEINPIPEMEGVSINTGGAVRWMLVDATGETHWVLEVGIQHYLAKGWRQVFVKKAS